MAQHKVLTDEFTIRSEWRCGMVGSNQNWQITYGPILNSNEVIFQWDSLGDVTITSAKVHATLDSPLTGADTRTVNGASFDSDGFAEVIIEDSTSFTAIFRFKANGSVYSDVNLHYADQSFSDVYLLIEYEPNYTPPNLVSYTDPSLVLGETYVKAVHMTELHTNVNRVRVAYGLSEHSFTSIISGETSLGGWNNHVLEIRNALDEANVNHEAWIELGDNYPRLDVLTQLRRVVQTVAEG